MVKEFPAEDKKRLEAMLLETEPTRKILDEIDQELLTQSASSIERIKEIARKATGAGNYLRKKWSSLSAAVKNHKANRYMEIKMACNTSGDKFVSDAATKEAEGYVAPLRIARDILEAYVKGADNTISYCRIQLGNEVKEAQVEI